MQARNQGGPWGLDIPKNSNFSPKTIRYLDFLPNNITTPNRVGQAICTVFVRYNYRSRGEDRLLSGLRKGLPGDALEGTLRKTRLARGPSSTADSSRRKAETVRDEWTASDGQRGRIIVINNMAASEFVGE